MATYDRVRDLPLKVESYRLEGLEIQASHDFSRRTTVIRLEGGGHEGLGEDVTYSGEDHAALQEAGPVLPLAGTHTLDGFSRLLDSLELFPSGASRQVFQDYRRWAYESAALDLALRQADLGLGEALGREAQPVTFVVSLRIEQPPRPDPVPLLLERYPGLRFKLDPTDGVGRGARGGARRDGRRRHRRPEGRLQGDARRPGRRPRSLPHGRGGLPRRLDRGPRPERARRIPCSRPTATGSPGTRRSTRSPTSRPSPSRRRRLNFKPSRFGSVGRLLDGYDHCAEQGIAHLRRRPVGARPRARPDPAPRVRSSIRRRRTTSRRRHSTSTASTRAPGLPTSPLPPQPSATGFRWGDGVSE